MKAAVLHANEDIRYEEFPTPETLPGTVKVRVRATGICGSDVPRSKPDPAIFLEAARRLDLDPRACLVLEDSFNGVRAGAAAGAVTVMVPDLMPVTDEMRGLFTAQCASLFEVLDKLKAGEF